jgi:PAS domain S-box-containing protein
VPLLLPFAVIWKSLAMQLTELPSPLVTLQETIDQWIKTVPNHNPELATQLRLGISDVNATIAQFQQQLTWEREQRQRAESEVRFLERMTQAIDQSAILEYQRTEADLRDSEARYRRIIETATEGIWVLDADETIEFTNGRLAQLLGYSVEEMQGKSLFDFLDSEGREIILPCLEQLRQGKPDPHDCKFCCKDGTDLWAIVSATPIFNAQGDYIGFLAMITDITERKRTRANLEQSLCLLQTTLESTVDGILAIDIFGNILNVNRQFLTQWNLPDSASSMPDDQTLLAATVELLKDPGSFLIQLQVELDQPDLETHGLLELHDGRFFERHSKPQKLGDRTIGRVISCRDVTDAKRSEAALAEREELLRTVVTNTPTILYALDRDGIFTLSEGKGLEAMNLKSGEVVGRSIFDLYEDHPDILQAVHQVLNGAESDLILNLNGVTYDNRVTPLLDQQGDMLGIIGVATDITARKQAEEALRDAKKDLEIRVEERTAELRHTNQQLQLEIAQRTQVEQSLRESQVCLQLLNNISRGITSGVSVEQVIKSTVQQIGQHFKTLRILYSVIIDGVITAVHSTQPEAMMMLEGAVLDVKQAPEYSALIERRHPIAITDVSQASFLAPFADAMIARGTRALLTVRVQHSAQQMGSLSFNSSEPHQWSDYEISTLTEIADYLSIVLQEAQAQQERQRAEERLRLFESVVVNGRDSIIITTGDPENPQITYVNAAFIESTGYAPEEVIGKTPRLLQGPKSDRAQLNKVRQALLDHTSIQIELINYRKDGSEFWVDLNLVPILDDHGALTHYVALQRDITDRKWSEKMLIATQARLKYLLSSNPSVIYTCHPNRNRSCTFVSENITQQLGYEVWQYLKESRFWLDRIHPDDLSRVLEHVSQLFEIGQLTCEYRFLHKDGSYRWLRDGMKLLRDQGQPVEIIGSVVDITDRKWAENQIHASLEEKEVLLKEIHHRVKNNLQVISSLLKLQAGYIKDDRILEVFKESQNRIRAMALIHEKLYQSEDLAKSNFAEYIRSLATDLFRSYSVNSRMVKLNLKVEDVRLSIDTAIPCGLIINELISNSLKYAFSAGQTGEINIHFFSETEDCYTLIVQDNGSGFPIDLDFRNTKSLGLQLVCSLTKQLHGTIDLERDRGVAFKITFAEQKQKG